MSYLVFRTVNRQKLYLSPTGRWVKTKVLGIAFPSREAAKAVADQHAGGIDTHAFRSF